jgi:hypothetical protein
VEDRKRRIAANEAVFREVNEQIETLNRGFETVGGGTMTMVCECADLGCAEQLVVGIADYERVRADATLFIIAPNHEQPDVERVVEEASGHHVVQKLPGLSSQVARATDPRT